MSTPTKTPAKRLGLKAFLKTQQHKAKYRQRSKILSISDPVLKAKTACNAVFDCSESGNSEKNFDCFKISIYAVYTTNKIL